jgi:octanoyl-[GcvH]:protein N-octanoyltransferase
MRVLRGRAATIADDHERTDAMVRRAVERDQPALRIWTPHQQVAFGRRDVRAEGYSRARAAAEQRGYPAVERQVGGRAVAFTGSTVSVVHAIPGGERTAIEDRYERATERFQRALATLGVDAHEGEPDGAFCPGTHSLQAAGKIAGLAQRVRRDVAIVAAVLVVRDHDRIGATLSPVYDALGVPFEPDSVGSIDRAGGNPDLEAVADAILTAYAPGDRTVVRVRET